MNVSKKVSLLPQLDEQSVLVLHIFERKKSRSSLLCWVFHKNRSFEDPLLCSLVIKIAKLQKKNYCTVRDYTYNLGLTKFGFPLIVKTIFK